MSRTKLTFLLLIILSLTGIPVFAQIQDFTFSGSNPESYQCFDDGGTFIDQVPTYDSVTGEFYCTVAGERVRAVLKPPQLQQLEIWFVRIVYTIWAMIASFSFLLLIYLGYQYLISQGDPTQIKAIRERIIRYIIGFALVFLAVPILITVFRLLGINDSVQCYQGLSDANNVGIGFQFFFSDLCTDPRGVAVSNPCDFGENATGLACSTPGISVNTCFIGPIRVCYSCTQGRIWQRQFVNCT
jgi:hypothetical protein